MCGVIGYQGKKAALPALLHGLAAMEYRGYDSAGVAVVANERIACVKKSGPLVCLTKALAGQRLPGHVGLGHIRWATHGAPTDTNAHPHFDCRRKVAIVHNGVIENSQSKAAWLTAAGHKLASDTDSEIFAHLIEHFYTGVTNLEQALVQALAAVTGTWALAAVSVREPEKIVAARLASPLIIGLISPGQAMVASDVSALGKYSKQVIYLEDHDLAVLSPHSYRIRNLASNRIVHRPMTGLVSKAAAQDKGAWPHFALKEIWAQPASVRAALRKQAGIEQAAAQIKGAERFIITGCGSAYYAGLVGKYLLEKLAGVPAAVELASELRYQPPVGRGQAMVMAISQSGETADTIAAVTEAKKHGAITLGLVNVEGSTLTRLVQTTLYTRAGPELAVVSTKSFTAQLAVLTLLASHLKGNVREMAEELAHIPEKIASILEQHWYIRQLAQKYIGAGNWLVLGRSFNYPIALEGALKIKEISYAHAEGMALGEMKHGALALVDNQLPSLAVIPAGVSYQKSLANMQEIKARGGRLVAIATAGDTLAGAVADDVIYIPPAPEPFTPLLTVIPLQLFAYYLAIERGLDADKPRNLAKSVTVE